MVRFPFKAVDLTHSLSSDIPTWDGSCGFNHAIEHDYDPKQVYQFRTHRIQMKEGIGTHMDSPAHCFKDGTTIDNLDLSQLISPGVVIDVSQVADARYRVSRQDLEVFEAKHGIIQSESFVMIRTGWSKYWKEPKRYQNDHVFPSVSKEAAKFFMDRDIVGIGVDTLSPDRPEDGFPVHALLLGSGKYIIENIANLDLLPPTGAFAVTLPIKIRGGTEAPIRLIGLLPR